MREITVHTPFNLLLDGATSHQRFDVGTQEVDDAVADHWWTKEHIAAEGDPDEVEAQVDEDPAPPAPPQEPGAGGETEGGGAQGKVDKTKAPAPAPAAAPTKDEIKARKAALRDQIKALGGTAPNNFASVEAHEAALEAAKADAAKG